MAASLSEIGRCLMEMNKLSDAKVYLEKTLKIYHQTTDNLGADKCVATSLHEIG